MPTTSTRLHNPSLIPFRRIPPRQHQRRLRILPLPVREFPCPHYTKFPPAVEGACGSVYVVLCFCFGEPGGQDGHPLLHVEMRLSMRLAFTLDTDVPAPARDGYAVLPLHV